ncbi:MAG: T9SS type A sorting domain-containing protein [Saprospiraceae bacterium]|nr:T9SS type A sorting domain-containing protein [Saprospiraceae bacterium]MBK9630215.1 T9SS type A sorting domain-containing protein [Saprospiraceae bacterium]
MKKYFFLAFISIALFQFISAQTIIGKIRHGGIERNYRLYLPKNYSSSRPSALVFNLHGYGSNATEQEIYGNFRPIADTAGFIIVHPNGTNDPNGSPYWNVGLIQSNVDDLGFLEALIDSLDKSYPIDHKKVFSTGMSNGGFMSLLLACQSNKFAAVASVTGTMTKLLPPNCQPSKAIPVMLIHGTADAVVPYLGNAGLLSVPAVLDHFSNLLKCSKTDISKQNVPDKVPGDGAQAEWQVYKNCTGGLEHFKITNGGHTWPGSVIPLPMTCQDFSASAEIWRFFRQSIENTSSTNNVNKIELSVYPNPADTWLNIQTSDLNTGLNLQINDALGRQVYVEKMTNQILKINVADWPSGLYHIRIEGATALEGKTVLIQRP